MFVYVYGQVDPADPSYIRVDAHILATPALVGALLFSSRNKRVSGYC